MSVQSQSQLAPCSLGMHVAWRTLYHSHTRLYRPSRELRLAVQWEHDPLPLVTAGLDQYSTFNRPVTVVSIDLSGSSDGACMYRRRVHVYVLVSNVLCDESY